MGALVGMTGCAEMASVGTDTGIELVGNKDGEERLLVGDAVVDASPAVGLKD